MQQKTNGPWVLIILCLFSCAEPENSGQQAPAGGRQARPSGQAVPVMAARSPLKEKPDVESATLAVLQAGDSLYLSGEVSSHRSRLSIGGQAYERAWLFARTAEGEAGWVHGAAVAEKLPLAMRLRSYFEPGTAQACRQYTRAFQSAERGKGVLPALRQAHQLQARLSQHPGLQVSVPQWLRSALPALQTTWLEDKQRFQWYVDYGAFLPPALASATEADEQLLELYYLAFPLDSIGYRYPDWVLEAAPGKAYSLLGRGKHLAFLQALQEKRSLQETAPAALSQLRQLLLNDIQQSSVAFWEKREKVLQELEQIASHPALDSLSRRELAFRLRAWSADSLPGTVTFNYRAGVHTNEQQRTN